MKRRKITITLGELIVAVTDEVSALMGNSPDKYLIVSYVVADLLTRHGRRAAKRPGSAVSRASH
jgi:hypothetical protein